MLVNLSLYIDLFLEVHGFPQANPSQKTVCFLEQMMSVDKCTSILIFCTKWMLLFLY